MNDGWVIIWEIPLKMISLNLTDDKSTFGSGNGLVRWRHQAIAWPNVVLDLCRHVASLGHNELKS